MLAAIEQVKANIDVVLALTAIQQNKTLVDFAPVIDAVRNAHTRVDFAPVLAVVEQVEPRQALHLFTRRFSRTRPRWTWHLPSIDPRCAHQSGLCPWARSSRTGQGQYSRAAVQRNKTLGDFALVIN